MSKSEQAAKARLWLVILAFALPVIVALGAWAVPAFIGALGVVLTSATFVKKEEVL